MKKKEQEIWRIKREGEKETEEGGGGGWESVEERQTTERNKKPLGYPPPTSSSSHSPSLDYRTPCYGWVYVQYGMDSWPSEKTLR